MTDHDRSVQREMGRCKHVRGIQHDTCNEGVSMRPRPCSCIVLKGFPSDGPPCALAVYPTREEVEAEMAADEAVFANIEKARASIVLATKGARGVRGTIACPIDGQNLAYKVASNGHIWAACANPDCVRWLE